MKYKVGDKVRIKSTDWYNKNKDKHGIIICGMMPFCGYMSCRCGTIVTISEILEWGYCIEEDYGENGWTDEMIEGHYEEENIDCEKCGLVRNSTRCLFMDNCPHNKQKNIIEIPKDYVLKDENGNTINATKIVLEKKKKGYPKTYDECCKVLNTDDDSIIDISVPLHYNHLLMSFTQLLICRDAYWKLYGEEKGLGKPWEPNWTSFEGYPAIYMYRYQITLSVVKDEHHLLVFPTAEMRNAFYENFKELIEMCKELL